MSNPDQIVPGRAAVERTVTGGSPLATARAAARARFRRLLGLHADQRGTISMLTLVILFAFVMILGMLINIGKEVDDKVKLQQAADASTYSSGVMLARGMNTIAFTNHLLCEFCSMTAYLREGRDRSSEKMVPDILAAWKKLGPIFARSSFAKFAALGPAISGKVPLEQEIVTSFSEMTAIKSKIILPALEYILGQPENQGGDPETHWVPQFQRAVVQAIPLVAQYTMAEVASRHAPAVRSSSAGSTSGTTRPRNAPLGAALWRWMVIPVGIAYEDDPYMRTLPAVDPTSTGTDAGRLSSGDLQVLQAQSREGRRQIAHWYLEQWIADPYWDLGPFEREDSTWNDPSWIDDPNATNRIRYPNDGGQAYAKMSQFANIYRIFACAQLEQLLTVDFPNTNLPHMLRVPATPSQRPYGVPDETAQPTDYSPSRQILERDFSWIGVVYWPHVAPTFPGLFKQPIQGDSVMFAEVQVYIPLKRYLCCDWVYWYTIRNPNGTTTRVPVNRYENWPSNWDLFNQNWSSRLVPATHPQLPAILASSPGQTAPGAILPNLNSLDTATINSINTH